MQEEEWEVCRCDHNLYTRQVKDKEARPLLSPSSPPLSCKMTRQRSATILFPCRRKRSFFSDFMRGLLAYRKSVCMYMESERHAPFPLLKQPPYLFHSLPRSTFVRLLQLVLRDFRCRIRRKAHCALLLCMHSRSRILRQYEVNMQKEQKRETARRSGTNETEERMEGR